MTTKGELTDQDIERLKQIGDAARRLAVMRESNNGATGPSWDCAPMADLLLLARIKDRRTEGDEQAEVISSFLILECSLESARKHIPAERRLGLAHLLADDIETKAERDHLLGELDNLLGEECAAVGPSVIKRAIAVIRRYRHRITEAITMGRSLSDLGHGLEATPDERPA